MLFQNTDGNGSEAVGEPARSAFETSTEMREAMLQWIEYLVPAAGDEPLLATGLAAAFIIVLAFVLHFVARHIILRIVHAVVKRSRTRWDDALVEHRVFHRLIPIVPLLVINRGMEAIPYVADEIIALVQRLAMATIVLVGVRALGALLSGVNSIYSRYDMSRGRPIKGYFQVVMILAWSAAIIVVIAAVVDRSPLFFLSGLGAMTAVLLLIFRDSLLSLVAGIQLTSNDLIRVGDWIEMPNFNADGDVVDIALNVVKVQNWDRTITVIPAHKFLEYSFKNWRSMFESGGRRIKRSINIDMNTVRFLNEEEISRFSRYVALREYMDEKVRELDDWNRTRVPEEVADVLANCRHLTNIGTFRAYVINYLRGHAKIHQDLIMIVRQLAPGPKGLPIEIYCFTNDTGWVSYEGIQADIFDHLLAVVHDFGLRIYQEPAGSDLRDAFGEVINRDDTGALSRDE